MNGGLKFTAALALAALAACGGDDGGTGPGNQGLLQDSWVATQWTYTNQANTSQTYNLLASVTGVNVTLTIGASSYSIVFTAPGVPSQSITGTYTVSGNNFVVTETGSSTPESIPFTLSNGNNTLSMVSSQSDWDFNGDGVDDPATLAMSFTRQ